VKVAVRVDGTISGSSDRPVTVTAKNPSCYKYTVVPAPGSIYGMYGDSTLDLIVTAFISQFQN
jgi:hypothetical protein